MRDALNPEEALALGSAIAGTAILFAVLAGPIAAAGYLLALGVSLGVNAHRARQRAISATSTPTED